MSASEFGFVFNDDESEIGVEVREPSAVAPLEAVPDELVDSVELAAVGGVELAAVDGDEESDRPVLRYVEYMPGTGHPVWPTTSWAFQAAVVAALAALLIGAGLAILIAIS